MNGKQKVVIKDHRGKQKVAKKESVTPAGESRKSARTEKDHCDKHENNQYVKKEREIIE